MDIYKVLSLVIGKIDVTFTLNNKAISPEEICKPNGLFPALIRRADQLSSFCLKHGLGVKFDKSADTTIGITAILDDTISNAFRIMCITEIVYEIIEASPNKKQVALDHLMYD
tara:strand:+ start:1857 stop:2195 length:339 start_codon:yes stop_codon:yes gene_type:complete